MLTPKFDNLVKQLQVLPGVGNKTAQRMALHLLNQKRPQGMALAQALDVAMEGIIECERCHSFSDDDICPICADPRRDDSVLCVVETASDVMALEQTAGYRGRYFVLGGHLSPLDGVSADDLNIDQLVRRLKAEPVEELMLATSTTVEGQTTAHFIKDAVQNHVDTITQMAQGIPMGGELGYLDSMTLAQAIRRRSQL